MFAVELLAELIRRGVEDVVLCPGSRSQALALAAAAAEQVGAIRLHVRLDERSAAFFALGVARETGIPAPVVVTSGTAVANLMPAVLEAHEGRVPLLLLTADRPVELRGIRSNQTTAQAGVFGGVTRLWRDVPPPEVAPDGDVRRDGGRDPGSLAVDALSAATGVLGALPPGPVHLNLAFREPLSGTEGFDEMVSAGFAAAAEEAAELRTSGAHAAIGMPVSGLEGHDGRADGIRASGGSAGGVEVHGDRASARFPDADTHVHRGDALAVVVAGEGAGPEAEAFAHAAGLPLLAEAVSGARYGREAITAYGTLLDDPSVGALVEQAIVFGHPTLTRQVPALLRREDVDVIVVDPYDEADHFDPARDARVVRAARVAEDHDPRALRRWLGAWVQPDRELQRQRSTLHEPDLDAALATGYKERSAYARAEVAVMREPVSRELLVESVWRATWPHDRLVLAASRLVRVLDGLAPARKLEVRANRGLAGIDGTVATALGVAATSQASDDPARAAGTTRVLLGDLALLHDAGSLLLPEHEPRPRIQLFVGNDGGGTIFDGLEVAGSAEPSAYDRVMYTPQGVRLDALAEAYGWAYRRVATRGDLERLLTEPVSGPTLVEIPLSR
ncbi:2-succinyl-5-enolpyruvyl-6-hydroxy-3-cyclohexene-1-carboxylic-acid synthase [Leucobacter triazinivorans]|uniref:2-succinyl-5-enolpyruvyl-6-hydroxy-3-cyclohexene-1-carboxylate synthase n=1 Tax=Leucobacter triazinivorans TaxID=1784719 RepID=A0A4P6KIG3_9MICO|nr:2-succinyl-5-enolpyruvyl-6-hydroxy-3-cyclohexene-1-carboxylic-acid synthase [Leucobacter triazinivorans]QBE50306.1 2-succinyl-5-enolpyruvyl-6-hydroxy-3-cyclohexene-1-carboxylic-acid synthase [Leucobacter triazinivorans]